jgi:hypothetical protein
MMSKGEDPKRKKEKEKRRKREKKKKRKEEKIWVIVFFLWLSWNKETMNTYVAQILKRSSQVKIDVVFALDVVFLEWWGSRTRKWTFLAVVLEIEKHQGEG